MDGADARSESGGELVKTALLIIATGEKYHQYVNPLLESARNFFVEHMSVVWTDNPGAIDADFVIEKEPLGYPGETLHRYHTILEQRQWLNRMFDQLFYIDVDMRFVAPVGEEVFSNGITATLHPGYVGTGGTPETRPSSNAFLSNNSAYYCGGFQGGNAKSYLMAALQIRQFIDWDAERDIIAVWHDESHWNKLLAFNPPAKVLDPSYCYPEGAGDYYLNKWKAAGISPTPKILALTKAGK